MTEPAEVPSVLDQFARALAEGVVSEMPGAQLYRTGEGLVPDGVAISHADVPDPGEIRFVVNPHDHGAERTFMVSVTELPSPAAPGPEEVRRRGVKLFLDETGGPQLWYSDGHVAYRLDSHSAPYGPDPDDRDLAIMEALLGLGLDRTREQRQA